MFSRFKMRTGDRQQMAEHTANSNNNMGTFDSSDHDFLQGRTRVVIVGGWSPGPLGHLKKVALEHGHETIEPKNLNRYMPPFPGMWCCHPYVLVVIFMLGATIYLAVTTTVHIVLRLMIVLLALGWCRLLVGIVVRTSIETSIRKIVAETEIHSGRVLLIGFSWGGCVVAEMIARGMVGPNQASALLIAPTTSIVARLALQEDAALRIAKLDLASADNKIAVVHGDYDASFCPHQDRWRNVSGVDLQMLPDNHVFLRSSSLRALERILLRFFQ